MDNQIFQNGDARYIYAFDELPFHHIMMIEEIYHFKRQQIEKKAARFDEVVASGGADYKCRAASYLLLPCDANGTPSTPDVKATRKFVEGLKGADVAKLEECITDFFSRRNLSDLESDVASRVFMTLDELARIGSQVMLANARANGNESSTPSPNEIDSSTPESSTNG